MAPPRRPPPTAPLDAPSRGGGLAAPAPVERERAVVLSVDAARHAYRVVTASGRALTVGRLKSGPGDTALLTPHTPVRIDYSLGTPYIDGVLPEEVPLRGDDPAGLTGTAGHGGADPALARNLGATFRAPGEPDDLMPGDQSLRSPSGSSVAALHGKVAQLFGSPMAQVRAFGADDAVEILTGLLRVVTWMGESRVLNEEGKVSFVWRGGSDQLTETGADEERYTLHLLLGHRGDLVRFEVTTPDQQPVFRVHVDARGKVSVLAADGVTSIAGREPASRVADMVHGAREVVTEGPVTERVAGDAAETFQGSRTTTVSGADTQLALRDRSVRVNRRLDTRVGEDEVRNVGGRRTTTVVGNDETTARGDAKLTARAIETTATGEATHTAQRVSVKAPSVKLGRNPSAHAVRFEQLQQALDQLNQHLSQLKTELRTHVHSLGMTPTSPSPTLSVSPTLAPYRLDLGPAKSNVVELE